MSTLIQQLNSEFKVLKKSSRHRETLKSTSTLISELESLYNEIEHEEDNSDKSHLDKSHFQKINDTCEDWKVIVKTDIKNTNSSLTKFSKKILEKIDEFELDEVYMYPIQKTEENLQMIDNALKLHLIRSGHITALNESTEITNLTPDKRGHEFAFLDASSNVDRTILNKFKEMKEILSKIQNKSLQDAINWTIKNEGRVLGHVGSDLEFKLHRLQYLLYYNNGEPIKAIEYAQKWFPKFIQSKVLSDQNLLNISKLMVSVLFDNNDERLPYFRDKQLLDSQFKEVELLFSKEFCSVMGFAFESSLFTIILTGMISTPNFLKFIKIKNLNDTLGWTSKDELPFEVNLPSFLKKYHPIFICPVSKEETTAENPPMSLPCHHIISKHSLEKLGSRHGSNFKCPYCPTICWAAQCKQVTFYHIS